MRKLGDQLHRGFLSGLRLHTVNLCAGKAVREGHLDFFIPPRWAIAHNLISTWASKPESWFSRL